MCIFQVLHRGRGGGAADYQTVSMELPKQTVEKRRPRFGNKSLLQVETRLEDVITKPKKVRMTFSSHANAELITCLNGTGLTMVMGPSPAPPV